MHKSKADLHGIIIGLDFGIKRMGVAIGQTITQTAEPRNILPMQEGEPRWTDIDSLIRTWRPVAFVVGVPLNMDGTEQWITERARQFAQQLAERTQLPVFEADERLTTVEARHRIFEAKGFRGLKKTPIDALAAKIFLEAWLRE